MRQLLALAHSRRNVRDWVEGGQSANDPFAHIRSWAGASYVEVPNSPFKAFMMTGIFSGSGW